MIKQNNLREKYEMIQSPEELLEFMSNNINYGYLGKNKKVYQIKDKKFQKDWEHQYILQTKTAILETGFGNCWDQTELERNWFLEHGYEIKTIFEMVALDYSNNYPSHSFLLFKNKDDNKWNWFEHSDEKNKGIHTMDSLKEILNYQLIEYISLLETFNISNNEIKKIIITDFVQPPKPLNTKDYMDWVTNSPKIENIFLNDTWNFGTDNDNLVNLVLKGQKRATSSLITDNDINSKAGDYSILTYDNKDYACILKIIKVERIKFKDMTQELAELEGEGDLSLAYWKKVHHDFFRSINPNFNESNEILFEIFEVVKIFNNNFIKLVIPELSEYAYEQKLLSDPDTMSYNAGYDVSYEGYNYDTGCIDFPKKRWKACLEKRVNEKSFFAYIKDTKLNKHVGYVNYHYNEANDRYECGIVIESINRGKGYAKKGLELLIKEAFNNGIEALYDNFEIDRPNTLKLFQSVGFKVVEETTWKKFNKDVKGVVVCLKKEDVTS